MDEEITKNEDYCISNKYQSDEFPLNYRKFLVGPYRVQESFVSECLQKIYCSGRLRGTTILDFGCGPTVHRIASASRQFNDIILSEWSESNRREVEKWLRGEKDALDWTPLLEQCARVEGYRDLQVGVDEIERRIRRSVKKVISCDALSKEILPEGLELREFDVISSCFCLEVCCPNVEVFKEALKKLVKYLKKGGVFVIVTVLEAKQYSVHETLPALSLTESNIKEALIEAGLDIRDWFSWKDTGNYEAFVDSGIAVSYSVKT